MSQETGEKIVDVLLRSAIEDSGSEKGPSPSYGLDYLESSSLVDG
jgi:hypothetical protein